MRIVASMYSSKATRRRPPSGMRARETRLLAARAPLSAPFFGGLRAPLQKVSADPYFFIVPVFPHFFPTLRPRRAGAVLRPRTRCRAARAPCSGTDRRAPNLAAKSVDRPLFLLYQFSPTFSHSPHSALRGRAEGARLGFGGSSAALAAWVVRVRVGGLGSGSRPRGEYRPTWLGI